MIMHCTYPHSPEKYDSCLTHASHFMEFKSSSSSSQIVFFCSLMHQVIFFLLLDWFFSPALEPIFLSLCCKGHLEKSPPPAPLSSMILAFALHVFNPFLLVPKLVPRRDREKCPLNTSVTLHILISQGRYICAPDLIKLTKIFQIKTSLQGLSLL